MGDLSEEGARPGGRPWRVHLPKSKPQCSSAGADSRPADQHAFLRLEARSEDRHVLPPHEARSTGDPIYARPLTCSASQTAKGAAGGSAKPEDHTSRTSYCLHSNPSI